MRGNYHRGRVLAFRVPRVRRSRSAGHHLGDGGGAEAALAHLTHPRWLGGLSASLAGGGEEKSKTTKLWISSE